MSGKLYLVATPIGNLEDITLRAIQTLKQVDVICAEDTRHSRKLLDRYEIHKKPVSYHEHNATTMAPQIADWVADGKHVAIITDAGTPGISDPGFRAVRAVVELGLDVEAIPGANAVTTALILSNLALDRFAFEGFLPVKKGRRTRIVELSTEARTMIFFEAPHKLKKTLDDLASAFGADRLAVVARELTKLHEEVLRISLSDLIDHFKVKAPKGEIVLVVEGLEAYRKKMKKLQTTEQSRIR